MKTNTILIQNIITPYRSRLFNVLSLKHFDFSVFYMAKTEVDRNWDASRIMMKHKFWLDRYGIYFCIKNFHIHINPILTLKVLFSRSTKNIILGASYNDINVIALVVAKKMHMTNKRFFFWAEANYLTNGARSESKFKCWLRKFVFSSVDGALIIPGKMSELTFKKWGIVDKKYIRLPNTISDDKLQYCPEKRNKETIPIFFMPIRLIESVKGAINFFEAIGRENIEKCRFWIAGDGEDKELYKEYIEKNNYTQNIELLGFCDSNRMEELYNTANVFVLPSFSDPSPLSMVEALKTHLPILCSLHCGNHYEVVDDEINGYCFNPLDQEDIKVKFEALFFRKNEWIQMGELSYSKYLKIYATENVAANFIRQYNLISK